MAVQEYANDNLGQHLDNGQGGFAGECVSLVIRVSHDVDGVPYGVLFCSNTGGARDLFEQFDGKIPQYFDRIVNDPNDYSQLPQAGDLIVWGSAMGAYGHVAVCLAPKPLTVFQQLGTPVFKPSEIHQYPSYYGVLGWLRPKVNENVTLDQLTQLYEDLLHRAPDQGGIDHYVGHYIYDFVLNDIKQSAEYAMVNAPKEVPSVPVTPDPVPAPEPAPAPQPEPHPTPTPDPLPSSTPEPAPQPEPIPTSEPQPAPVPPTPSVVVSQKPLWIRLLAWLVSLIPGKR